MLPGRSGDARFSAPNCFAFEVASASCAVWLSFCACWRWSTSPPFALPDSADGPCCSPFGPSLQGFSPYGLPPYGFGCCSLHGAGFPLPWSQQPPSAVASPERASPPTPFCDCSFDWPVWFAFHAAASPELERFDCSTSPVLQCQATQTGTFTFTGRICVALDVADADCVVLLAFDASCDCVTSPP